MGLSGLWGIGFRIPLRGSSGFQVTPGLAVLEIGHPNITNGIVLYPKHCLGLV